MKIFYRLLCILIFMPAFSFGQYTVNNFAAPIPSTSSNATCFQLTAPDFYQRGSVWNNTPVDLSQSFVVNARLYFGTLDEGADGIAFMLQNEGTSYIGNWGAGLGYHRFNGENVLMPVDVPGPVPSFIVEFDTWQNADIYGQNIGDPAEDHLGFMSNSNAYHTMSTALQAPHPFSANIEDGQWHDVQFSWNAATKTMTVSFTTTNSPLVVQTFSYTGDIVNTIFNGNPMAYWGFTASTGSWNPNEHRVCIVTPPPPPPPPGDCGQLRTQTPGGWGAPPHGNNPASYMYSHFAAAFPSGLTIGNTPNYNIKLTSPTAVTNFLPCGGPSKKLTQNYTNPAGSSIKNTLAGHLAALTLSVTFDQADPSFGTAGIHLGDMLIGSGPFAGWTVTNFLAEANKVLGGVASSYSIQDALTTASAINENYVDGTTDNGYLDCPNGNQNRRSANQASQTTAVQQVENGIRPNPSRGMFELVVNAETEGTAQVIITNTNGSVVERRTFPVHGQQQSIRFDMTKHAAGIYIVKLITSSGEKVYKLAVQ